MRRIRGEGWQEEMLVGFYRAGGLAIMVSHTMGALANGGHGTLLGGVNYSAGGRRRLPGMRVKFSEREIDSGARGSRPNTGIKTGKTLLQCVFRTAARHCFNYFFGIFRVFFVPLRGSWWLRLLEVFGAARHTHPIAVDRSSLAYSFTGIVRTKALEMRLGSMQRRK